MNERRVRTATPPLRATFTAPASKSVTHRALVAAALASGPSRLLGPLEADDTRATRDGLEALGVDIEKTDGSWTVRGGAGVVPGGGEVDLLESGTSLRFLLAVASLGRRASLLDGSPRLRERPVEELTQALARLGGTVLRGGPGAGLPLVVGGGTGPEGGVVTLASGRSSQFASALLLIGARLPLGLDLTLAPPVVSLPYVELSGKVLTEFGVPIERTEIHRWRVSPGDYRGREYRIEGDHSSVSYFLAAAAVVGGKVKVDGLDPASPQPDGRLCEILSHLGCAARTGADWIEVEGSGRIPPFDLDLSAAPDLVPTLAVLALFAEGACAVRGVSHLRFKESDRLEVLAQNLRALGRPARAGGDVLEVSGSSASGLRGGRILTGSDHRMAMAFAVAGLRLDGVVVDDPHCVAKSNPRFWDEFSRLEG